MGSQRFHDARASKSITDSTHLYYFHTDLLSLRLNCRFTPHLYWFNESSASRQCHDALCESRRTARHPHRTRLLPSW
ncbi:hypothetical protein EMIT0P2_40263 [Pseudomonas sp. IT-P2]